MVPHIHTHEKIKRWSCAIFNLFPSICLPTSHPLGVSHPNFQAPSNIHFIITSVHLDNCTHHTTFKIFLVLESIVIFINSGFFVFFFFLAFAKHALERIPQNDGNFRQPNNTMREMQFSYILPAYCAFLIGSLACKAHVDEYLLAAGGRWKGFFIDEVQLKKFASLDHLSFDLTMLNII